MSEAKVAVDQRTNACANPKAQFHGKPITIDDVLASPLVCDPLHLLEIVMPCSGATAFVVARDDIARAAPHPPVALRGFGEQTTHSTLASLPDVTRTGIIRSAGRAFETAGAKLNLLDNISSYGWKPDYAKQREQIVKAMTVPQIKTLSAKYLDPNKMVWLVVGDAKTQLPRLKELGYGEPILLNK